MKQLLLPIKWYVVSSIYLLIIILFHWGLHPAIGTLVFVIGGFIGLFILDATELAINVEPSPLRNMLTQFIIIVLAFFVVTSTQTNLGSGVILFLSLRILIGQWQDFTRDRNITSWLPQIKTEQHQIYLIIISLLQIFATLFFIFI